MACPVCSHTMQHVNGTSRVFWCPRCGTLKDCDVRAAAGLTEEVEEGGNDLGVEQPKLIGRAFRVNQSILDLLADYGVPITQSDPMGVHREKINRAVADSEECFGSPSL